MPEAERKSPFSKGSQFGDWVCRNCHNCRKYDQAKEPTCEIDIALGLAYLSDGNVPAEIYQRMGAAENEMCYGWTCKEIEPINEKQEVGK